MRSPVWPTCLLEQKTRVSKPKTKTPAKSLGLRRSISPAARKYGGPLFFSRRRPLSAVSCFRVVALFSLLATAPAAAVDNPLGAFADINPAASCEHAHPMN
jgi:hypothetical protein